MLTQNLSLNSTIAALRQFAFELRSSGINLVDDHVQPAAMLFDVMQHAGIPQNAISLVLDQDELEALGCIDDQPQPIMAWCQFCSKAAVNIADYRSEHLLVCEQHFEMCESHNK